MSDPTTTAGQRLLSRTIDMGYGLGFEADIIAIEREAAAQSQPEAGLREAVGDLVSLMPHDRYDLLRPATRTLIESVLSDQDLATPAAGLDAEAIRRAVHDAWPQDLEHNDRCERMGYDVAARLAKEPTADEVAG